MNNNSRQSFMIDLNRQKEIFDEYKNVINPTSNLLLMGNLAFINIIKSFDSDRFSFAEIAEQIKNFIGQSDISENEKNAYVNFIDEIYPLYRKYQIKYGKEEYYFEANRLNNDNATETKRKKITVRFVKNNDLFVQHISKFINDYYHFCQKHSEVEKRQKAATTIGNKIKVMAGVDGLEGGAAITEILNKIHASNYSNARKSDVKSFVLRIIGTHAKEDETDKKKSYNSEMNI